MTHDMWKQIEELTKQQEQGASTWLKLQNDGDKAVVVFLGEPYCRQAKFAEGKYLPFDEDMKAEGVRPVLRIALNVALCDTKEVKVIEQGSMFFKDLVRVRDKYSFEKWAFEITRCGAAKDPKTKYSILPDHQLSPEELRVVQSLKLTDLVQLYEGVKATDDPVSPEVAQSLAAELKTLPREAADRFCDKLGIQRVRDLKTSQLGAAKALVQALTSEYRGAGVDRYA